MGRDSAVVGVIQNSGKALDPKFAQDYSREDLQDCGDSRPIIGHGASADDKLDGSAHLRAG